MSSPLSSVSFARQRILRQRGGGMRRVFLLPNSARGRPWLVPSDPASNCKTGLTEGLGDLQIDLMHKDLEPAFTSGILLGKASNCSRRGNGGTPNPLTHSESPIDVRH